MQKYNLNLARLISQNSHNKDISDDINIENENESIFAAERDYKKFNHGK